MTKAKRLAPAFALAALLASTTAHADVTTDQARNLEGQLRDWLSGLFKPAVKIGDRPVRVTAEGDHFRLEMPIPPLGAAGMSVPGPVTMSARPLPDGRWALDDLRVPLPLRYTAPARLTRPGQQLDSLDATVGSQDFHGVFDFTFAQPSSYDQHFTDLHTATVQSIMTPAAKPPPPRPGTPDKPQATAPHTVTIRSTTDTARLSGHSLWQPVGGGRVDMTAESTFDRIRGQLSPSDSRPTTYTAEHGDFAAHLRNVAPDTVATMVRAISALVPSFAANQDHPTPEQRALLRQLVYALRDASSGFDVVQTAENVHVDTAGQSVTFKRFINGVEGAAPGGRLRLATRLVVDGLDSPAIPEGVYRDYLPRHIALKPRVSGVPSEDVVKLLLKAIDTDSKDMPGLAGDAMALLSAGPLEVAIDELAIDLGAASLTGTGAIDIASPTDITGKADLTAHGLDALIRRANTTPQLKQIAPALLLVKGLGQQNGDETVWHITYIQGTVMVNDTDLSAMLGRGPK